MGWVADQKNLIPLRMVTIQNICAINSIRFWQSCFVLSPTNFHISLRHNSIKRWDIDCLSDINFYSPLEIKLIIIVRQLSKYLISLNFFILDFLQINRNIFLRNNFKRCNESPNRNLFPLFGSHKLDLLSDGKIVSLCGLKSKRS